ncbi:hypothetical protein BDZ89DRAFT_1136696 [Hymenopellis radicata]|nr:hypothetical protein BDZ89DRAFT_1136696 [Hymenopellis radicata]
MGRLVPVYGWNSSAEPAESPADMESSPPLPASAASQPNNIARNVPCKPRVIRHTTETRDLTLTLAQRPNESCKDFFKRRALTYKDLELSESEVNKAQRLVREKTACWFRYPGLSVPTYEWIPGSRYGYGTRVLIPPEKVREVWGRYGDTHRRYDAWTNEWDLNIEFDLELKYPDDEAPTVAPRLAPVLEIQTLPVETILHLRYGYRVPVPTSSHSPLPPYLPSVVFETYLSYIGAPRTSPSSAQIYNIIRTLETECITKPQPNIQNDLHYNIYYPSNFLPNVRNSSFRFKKLLRESGPPWHRIRCANSSRPSNVEVLVSSSIDLLTILRHHSARTISDMVAFFVRNGLSWSTAFAELQSFPIVTYSPNSWRLRTDEYAVYVQKRAELLRNPAVARAALMHGGLVWRLAKEHVNVRCLPPAPPRAVASFSCAPGMYVHYDALTEDEIAVICGVYDHSASWFPTPAVWRECGWALGFWTADAEKWFQGHVQRCAVGVETCRSQEFWSEVLRRRSEAKGVEILRMMERLAGEFVDGYLEAEGLETVLLPRRRLANFSCAFPAFR